MSDSNQKNSLNPYAMIGAVFVGVVLGFSTWYIVHLRERNAHLDREVSDLYTANDDLKIDNVALRVMMVGANLENTSLVYQLGREKDHVIVLGEKVRKLGKEKKKLVKKNETQKLAIIELKEKVALLEKVNQELVAGQNHPPNGIASPACAPGGF